METPRGAITENELESKKRMLEQNCHEEPLATREMSKDVGCVPNEEAICDHSEEFDAFEEVEPGAFQRHTREAHVCRPHRHNRVVVWEHI